MQPLYNIGLEALGFANYQSIQFAAERRFRHDFFFQVSYTGARDLTNVAGGNRGSAFLYGPGAANRTVADRFNTRSPSPSASGCAWM
ncbi:MAG: hypothetical protein IT165_00125 [Bryobacterales bacterium]|nr:hypothetical protein [Bryobacterales bacterium]